MPGASVRDLSKMALKPMNYKDAPEGPRSPETFVGYWINRASRLIVRDLDERLRPHGLAASQLPVLRALGEGQALSQKDLARHARVEQPTMAEMLVRMERDGIVKREANPEDKRGVLISLTPRSRTKMAKSRSTLIDAERTAMTGLSENERQLLRELLKRVVNNLERASDQSQQNCRGTI